MNRRGFPLAAWSLAIVVVASLAWKGSATAAEVPLTGGSKVETRLTTVTGPMGEPSIAPSDSGGVVEAPDTTPDVSASAQDAPAGFWTQVGRSGPVQLTNGVVEGIYDVIAGSAKMAVQLARISAEGQAIADRQQAALITGDPTPIEVSPESQAFVSSMADSAATLAEHPITTVGDFLGSRYDTAVHGTSFQRGHLIGEGLTVVAPLLKWLPGLRPAMRVAAAGQPMEEAAAGVRLPIASPPAPDALPIEGPVDVARSSDDPLPSPSSADSAPECVGAQCAALCFAPETLVETEDGLRPIDTLKAGDRVLARDPETAALAYKPVLRMIITPRRALETLVVVSALGQMESVRVTPNHPFFVRGRGWVEASQIVPNEDALSDDSGGELRVASAASMAEGSTVYNMEVQDFHTYFVGRSHAWVHNQSVNSCPGIRSAEQRVWGVTSDELRGATLVSRVANAQHGVMGSEIVTLRLADGRQVRGVFKPLAGEKTYGDLKAGTLYLREISASRVNNALGLDIVPPTVEMTLGGQKGSVQLFAENTVRAQGANQANLDPILRDRMTALDYLIQNRDRHGNNWLIRSDGATSRPVAIDHGLSFPSGAMNVAAPALRPETRALLAQADPNGLQASLREVGLDEGAIQGVLTRLQTIRTNAGVAAQVPAAPLPAAPRAVPQPAPIAPLQAQFVNGQRQVVVNGRWQIVPPGQNQIAVNGQWVRVLEPPAPPPPPPMAPLQAQLVNGQRQVIVNGRWQIVPPGQNQIAVNGQWVRVLEPPVAAQPLRARVINGQRYVMVNRQWQLVPPGQNRVIVNGQWVQVI